MTDPQLLCAVDPALVDHVRQLLDDAGVPSSESPREDGRVAVAVAPADEEHARAVIGLVLPHLLDDEGPTPPGTLSQRLIRTEEPGTGLPGGLVDGRMTFGYADPLEDHPDDHDDFVPPHPPPVPRPRDRIARAAWVGVIGGPLLLIAAVLLGLPGILTTAGLLTFFVGFGVLVFRHEERDRHGDGWDDGAVV